MATVIDALVVTLGLDPSAFTRAQKEAAAAALKSQKDIERAARETERAVERSLKEQARAQERAARDAARAQMRAEREAARESARAVKEKATAEAKAAKETAEAQEKVGASISSTGRRLLGLYALFTAGQGIKAFVANITSADAALGRFADSIGVAPTAVSNLGLAVERSGGNAQAAAAGYQALSDAIQSIKTGHASESFLQAISMLSSMGGVAINLNDSREKQMAALLADINKAGKKDAALASALGRQAGVGQDLVNFALKNSPEQQAAELAKSHQLGGATPESIKATQELLAQYAALKQASEDLGRQIFVSLAPAINEALKGVLDWVAANKEWLKSAITDQVKAFADYLRTIDWKAIGEDIKGIASDANAVAQAFGGWKNLIEGIFILWTGAKFASAMANIIKFMSLMKMPLPPWAMAFLGVATVGGDTNAPDPTRQQRAEAKEKEQEADRRGELYGWKDFVPKMLGGSGRAWRSKAERERAGNDALRERGAHAAGEGRSAEAPAATGKPGTYRPQYKLGDADLSDDVVNTVAGEATSSQTSIDAVINNMMNRVGTSSYGSSRNLREVARAPGQYAGYRHATAEQAARIRERIRAIASGSVPDNTNGSNEYRASSYRGPWYQHHADAPVIGGNRFAFNPKGGRGSYSPYQPQKTPPMKKAPEQHSWWNGAPGAAAYANQLQHVAASNTFSHSIDNSQRNTSSHVGQIVVQTAATDGRGVGDSLRADLQRRGLLGQSDYGLA